MWKNLYQCVAVYKKPLISILCFIVIGIGAWHVVYNQFGLHGHYYSNPNWEGEPSRSQIDKIPYLKGDTGYHLLSVPVYSVKWSGWIVTDEPGEYRFATNSDDGSMLWIDDHLVVDNGGFHGLERVSQVISLEKGVHQIEISYLQMGGFSVMQTLWTPPGKEESLIPQEAFFPTPPGWGLLFVRNVVIFLTHIPQFVWGILIVLGLVCVLRTYLTFSEMLAYLRRHPHVAAWLIFGGIAVLILSSALQFDFRSNPKSGDQASHFLQALSLAYDGDLQYEERDILRWREVGWGHDPGYLFFRRYSKGYAFAKPYGYSLFLAPFIRIFGPITGSMLANCSLFALTIFLSAVMLRMRYTGSLIPVLLGGLYFASYPYFYLYVIHTELFLMCITAAYFYLLLSYFKKKSLGYLYGATILFAFAVSEKVQFLLLFAPLLLVAIIHGNRLKQKLLLVPVVIIGFLLSISPYLVYSDYNAWNPYSGERYWSYVLPFTPEYDEAKDAEAVAAQKMTTGSFFSIQYIVKTIKSHIKYPVGLLQTISYYFLGAHTGMFIFVPLAGFLIFGTIRLCCLNWKSVAILLGIFLYIIFYIVLFPRNYYGGGQSLGNRYFLQMLPSVLALLSTVTLSKRFLWVAASLGFALPVIFLWPHHQNPSGAYSKISRTTFLQRCMPLETNQWALDEFEKHDKPVNIHMIPWHPNWRYLWPFMRPYLFIEHQLHESEIVTRYGKRYTNIAQGEFFHRMFEEPRGEIFIGQGFRFPETYHVWAYRDQDSSLILKASGTEKLCVTLHPYQIETKVRFERQGKETTATLPTILCLSPEGKKKENLAYVRISDVVENFFPKGTLFYSLQLTQEHDFTVIAPENIIEFH